MAFGPEYTKINTIWQRDGKGLIIPGQWATPEIEYLSVNDWQWTEKVDGTNIRLHWNGEEVTVGGRTDAAQLPAKLVAQIAAHVDVARWHDIFDDDVTDATVYCEGFGAGIQAAGKHYRDDQALICFDVRVGPWWLQDDDRYQIAAGLGLPLVPVIGFMTPQEASYAIHKGSIESHWANARIEGLVGRPAQQLFDRKGNRILAKIKTADWTRYDAKAGK